MIEDEVDPRPGDEGRQACEKVHGLEDEVARAVRPCGLEPEDDAPIVEEPEPVLRDGRPQEVPAELFETRPILTAHRDIGMEVEPLEVRVPGPPGDNPVSLRVAAQSHGSRTRPGAQGYTPLHGGNAEAGQRRGLLSYRIGS